MGRAGRQIRVKVGRLTDRLERDLRDAVADEARQIIWDEQGAINRVTGTLQDSITAEFDQGGLYAEVGPHDPDAYYAVFVEWGRKNAPARPFATPAAERARRRWPRHAAAVARRAIDRG